MSLPNAFITLLTSPSYLPGALVLLHSLLDLHPEPRDFKTVCLVTPETVDAKSIKQLREAGWDMVIGVEPIGSGKGGAAELRLMGRPDLDFALTKLHIFRLHTLFSTLIYLDADTLPIRPLSHLFTTTNPHVISACPDTGWPDCFNSGVMVIRPRESDWKGLRNLLKNGEGEDGIYLPEGAGNGSFDGADQGLLNEWFSEEGGGGAWNRLPFVYNVTPSAAYTYAPAYRRYGHKINLVHFIGPNKPWANLQGRPAGMSVTNKQNDSYDYPSLIDRWYDVYDRHIRPTAAHDPDQARRFAVPEHVAVWNLGTGVPVQPKDRLDLDQLRQAAGAGLSALKPGQYMSLPLDGRVDLIMPRPKARVPSPKNATESPSAVASPTHIVAPLPQTIQQQMHRPATWDASRYSPPKKGGPEMAIKMDQWYAPAWEQKPSQQSSYYQQQQAPSQPQYPTLPSSVTGDQWYKEYHGKIPDKKHIKAVFPWEQFGESHRRPDRVFPRGDSPPPQPQSTGPPALSVQNPTPPIEPRRESPPPPPPPKSMADSMASYTNAWDSMPSIKRYVDRITGRPNAPTSLGIRRESTLDPISIQSVPPTPTKEKANHLRSTSLDRRSDVSGDGDDEDEESSEGDQNSPRVSMSQWGKEQQKGVIGAYPTNVKYVDRHVQTDSPNMSDAKVQAVPGGGPSPAVKTVALPGMTPTSKYSPTQSSGEPEPRRRISRQSSSSDTVTPLGGPMTPPSDTPGPGSARRGIPFPVGPHVRSVHTQSGSVTHGRRPSYGQQFSSSSTVTSGQGNGGVRRPSWGQGGQQPRLDAKTNEGIPTSHDLSLSAGSGSENAGQSASGGAGGRYFDPATDVDVRKRDTQDVLSRFMKVGSFSQGSPGTSNSALGLK